MQNFLPALLAEFVFWLAEQGLLTRDPTIGEVKLMIKISPTAAHLSPWPRKNSAPNN